MGDCLVHNRRIPRFLDSGQCIKVVEAEYIQAGSGPLHLQQAKYQVQLTNERIRTGTPG